MLTRVRLERFTAFKRLDIPLNAGINVLIGANGTGKSHLLKVGYAACEATRPGANFGEKLIRLFLPSNRAMGRLVKRQQGEFPRCSRSLARRPEAPYLLLQPLESRVFRHGDRPCSLGRGVD